MLLEGQTETPLVQILVRRGDAVLQLTTGAVDESTTTFLGITPADPDEQPAMGQELAELIFTRLFD